MATHIGGEVGVEQHLASGFASGDRCLGDLVEHGVEAGIDQIAMGFDDQQHPLDVLHPEPTIGVWRPSGM